MSEHNLIQKIEGAISVLSNDVQFCGTRNELRKAEAALSTLASAYDDLYAKCSGAIVKPTHTVDGIQVLTVEAPRFAAFYDTVYVNVTVINTRPVASPAFTLNLMNDGHIIPFNRQEIDQQPSMKPFELRTLRAICEARGQEGDFDIQLDIRSDSGNNLPAYIRVPIHIGFKPEQIQETLRNGSKDA